MGRLARECKAPSGDELSTGQIPRLLNGSRKCSLWLALEVERLVGTPVDSWVKPPKGRPIAA